jgi:Tfp pilus assembly protein FimV
MRAPFRPLTLTALLGAGSVAAFAIGLGAPALESTIGQPLRVRIPVQLQPGETLTPDCIVLAPPDPAEAFDQRLPPARLEVSGDGREVLVTTSQGVNSAVVNFALRADCAAQTLSRHYTLLPEPPGTPAPAPPPPPRGAPAAQPGGPADTRWELRPGESVRAIAGAIYPGAPELQQRLVAAILRASPGAFPEGDPDRPASGAVIVIPDLRTIGAVSAPRPAQVRPRTRAEAAAEEFPPAPRLAPLAEYRDLLQKIAQLETMVAEMRRGLARLAAAAAPRAPASAPPAGAPAARQAGDSGLGMLAAAGAGAALLLALAAAALHLLRKRRPAAAAAPGVAATRPAPAGESAPPSAPTGVDAALEEARHSMSQGYPERAFQLLDQQIRAQPGETRAWMLLFTILRSQHMTTEFAELALRFRATNPVPENWREVQRLGRELEPDSPLYRDEAAPAGADDELVVVVEPTPSR